MKHEEKVNKDLSPRCYANISNSSGDDIGFQGQLPTAVAKLSAQELMLSSTANPTTPETVKIRNLRRCDVDTQAPVKDQFEFFDVNGSKRNINNSKGGCTLF